LKRTPVLIAISLILLLIVAACGAGNRNDTAATGDGTFASSVTIGPLCPVEPCETLYGHPYHNLELVLMQPGGVRIIAPLTDDGEFSVAVPAGVYDVHLSPCMYMGCGTVFNAPHGAPVTVVSGKTSNTRFDIDTGIRAPAGPDGGVESLVRRLRDTGATVEIGEPAFQGFFSLPGQILQVN